MPYVYVTLAGLLIAASNLFIRRSVDLKGNSTGGDPFIIQRLIGAAFLSAILILINDAIFTFDPIMLLLGVIGGLFLGGLMWSIGQTLQRGGSAFSLAIINVACIIPPILMALIFGKEFGHAYTLQNAIGAFLVSAGIFWMACSAMQEPWKKRWLLFVSAAFFIHACFLTFFQWRALLCKEGLPESILIPFHCHASNGESFTLAMFGTACLMQLFLKKRSQSTSFSLKQTFFHGFIGGMVNGLGNFFVLSAADVASTATEKALIFPLYCVWLITFCNLWGKAFYQEKIHWPASALCFAGILTGVV